MLCKNCKVEEAINFYVATVVCPSCFIALDSGSLGYLYGYYTEASEDDWLRWEQGALEKESIECFKMGREDAMGEIKDGLEESLAEEFRLTIIPQF